MQKQITFIIATYNASSTLRTCLESIVGQTTDECEVVVIDGGSTDSTCEIVRSFGNSIAYTISEKDEGIYDAWNKGVGKASGRWVAFVGADDILLPGAVQNYLDVIKNTPDIDTYDYICGHNEYVDYAGKLLKILGSEPCWSAMRKSMVAAHVASLHNKKNLFETVGLYDYKHFKICADYELLMRKRDQLSYIIIPAHIARMKTGGMSFTTKALIETYLIRKKHHSVSAVYNAILFCWDWLLFKFFLFRKKCGE